ncbi:MAG: 4-vinyl reductase [archaeon]
MLNKFYSQFDMTGNLHYLHNNLYLMNIPFFMLPIEALTGLLEITDVEIQKKIYTQVKKSTKDKMLPQFGLYFGTTDKKKETNFILEYLTYSGWGSVQIIDLEIESKRAIIVVENSPFAAALKGKIQLPADVFLRGILAGLFSKIFEEDIDCVEAECAAHTSERCKFIIKPKLEFDFGNPIVQQQISHE